MLNRCHRRVSFKAFFATTFLGLALGMTENASAQMVRIGPMGGFSLRTPMISVDTLPFGAGTRVRGPFAGVDTGAYRFPGPPVFVVPRSEAYPYQPPTYGPGANLQRRYDYGYGYGADLDVYGSPYDYGSPYNYGSPYDDYVGPDSLAVPSPVLPRYPNVYAEQPAMQPYGPAAPYLPADPYASSVPPSNLPSGYSAPGYSAPGYSAPGYSPPYAPMGSAPTLSSPQPIPSFDASSIPPNGFGLNLHDAATRLEQGLSQREDGEVWLDYLRPRDILAVIDGSDPSKTTTDLQTLFRNYEGVAGSQELSHVWVIDGFRQTHQGLKEWLDAHAPMNVEDAAQSPIQSSSVQSNAVKPSSAKSSSLPELAAPIAPAKSNPKVEPQFEELIPPGEPEPADDAREQKAPAEKPNKKSGVQSL